ncbi:DUF1542 domain-containing protein, partial [Streptococcus pseudopneumoniae]|uniref:DUF1542 domain-containing protein n=1 Tax=Streptococcus pseudopneumoniae TaxID=257758 RepID=UPI001419E09F
MFYSEKDDREKRLRFSIRKVSFGAASVAVAALYLFMGSGAVSAEEAQAVQSNEEVAADKDSETEKKSENQQPTYAASAAKEQGSATNTEAGDEGKQESHPETKEEEANSSERSETTTKTQSDEDSVSGDSSSPKSEGEGTRSEEASSKPKVRKRRDVDPAPPATVTDDDPDANQTYEVPGDGASVDDLATKLKDLPETVENEKKLAKIDEIGATKNINQGEVKELEEFGGWKAVSADGEAGKFAVARKTTDGVFPIETVNTVKENITQNRTWTSESVVDSVNNHVLLLSEVRTEKTKNQEVFDNTSYIENGEGKTIARGLKGYNGIEKTFKTFSPTVGSTTKVSFKTGYTGDIDGSKAKYKVEVLGRTNENSILTSLYTATFDPSRSTTNANMTVNMARDGKSASFTTTRGTTTKDVLNKELANSNHRPNGKTGTFTSKDIEIPVGYTEYVVRISSADNTHLGMGYQVPWKHYALPIAGSGFTVSQDTSKVAKDLSEKVYAKLTAGKEEDTKWSTPETKDAYREKLKKIKNKIDSGASDTSEYKTVVIEAVEQWKMLNEEQKIKDKAKEAVAAKLEEKEEVIENNTKLSPAEKAAAKEAAKKAAEDAKQAITNADSQDKVTNEKNKGTTAISNVNPIGTENAVNAIAEVAARKMADIDDNDKLSEAEKEAAKEEVAEAVRKAGEAIRKAKETKNQGGVDQAQEDVISEVNAINPVGKDKAKKAIQDELAKKEAEIEG